MKESLPTKKMENNIETIEQELLRKAGSLQESYRRDYESKMEVAVGPIDRHVEEVIKNIPDEIIRNDIERVVRILKNEGVSSEAEEEIFNIVFNTNKALYIDNRPYIRMAKRALSEYRMSLMIDELAKKENLNVSDLRKIVRINFDLNGLKPMNDLGGHERGNEGLKIFSDVLKDGQTTKWLEEAGFKVIPSSEGGDEFGMVISGIDNDRPIDDILIQEIKRKYIKEVYSVKAGQLVDFKDEEVQGRILESGKNRSYIEEAIESGFEFKMSTSMGVARMDQALMELEISPDKPYEKIIREVIGRMFKIADNQAIKNKTEFKKNLAESQDPKDRMLSDLIDRDKGAKQKEEMIKKQAEENSELRAMLIELGLTEEEINRKIEEKRSKSKVSEPNIAA